MSGAHSVEASLDTDTLAGAAAHVAHLLAERGETLAVAETAAGGLMSATLLAIPGASAWFLGGVVAYSAEAKARWLGLERSAFGAAGAASQVAAVAMADAVRTQVGATWGVAEAGIAGPQTGRRSSKPAGLAFVAVAGPACLVAEVRSGFDDRPRNQQAFALAALQLLVTALREAHSAPRPSSTHSPQ